MKQSDRWKGEIPKSNDKSHQSISSEVYDAMTKSYLDIMRDFYRVRYPDTLYKLYYEDEQIQND